MKIRTMLGLAAVGGLAYYHKQRGGEWTMDSFKDTGRHLWKTLQESGEKAKKGARDAMDEATRKADKLASKAQGGDYRH